MSEFTQLLEEAIRRTGVERYRHLCSEANTLPPPNSPADWRRWIAERHWERPVGLAAVLDGTWPPPPCGSC